MNEYEANKKWIEMGLPLCGWGLEDYDPYACFKTAEEYYKFLDECAKREQYEELT